MEIMMKEPVMTTMMSMEPTMRSMSVMMTQMKTPMIEAMAVVKENKDVDDVEQTKI